MKLQSISKIYKFFHDKKGISLPIFAGFALVTVGVVTTGIDINRYIEVRSALQAAADQAVLSASTLPKTKQIETCQELFSKTIASERFSSFVTSNQHSCTHEDTTKNGKTYQSVVINAKVGVKTYFSDSLGMQRLTVDVTAAAAEERDNIELVYAFSTQGSMCTTTQRTAAANSNTNQIEIRPDPTCQKFNIAKNGMIESIDALLEKINPDKIQIGLVPFNYKVKLPNTNQIPPSFLSLEPDKQFFSEFTNQEPLPPVVPLTKNFDSVKNILTNMTLSENIEPWGRADIGMHTSALMLDNTQNSYFDNHAPQAFGKAKKYVILMSDGSNIGCCYTNNPNGNFNNQYIYYYKPYDVHMLDICKKLKDQGVKIFTILLDVNKKDTGGTEINNAMARCASGEYQSVSEEKDPAALLECSKKSYCFNIDKQDNLDDAYQQIISIITKPSLDQ